MCYDFVHPCDDQLADQIATLAGIDNFFLVCISTMNFLYVPDRVIIEKIKDFLSRRRILLHPIVQDEMRGILISADTKSLQRFHGNRKLYDEFNDQPVHLFNQAQ